MVDGRREVNVEELHEKGKLNNHILTNHKNERVKNDLTSRGLRGVPGGRGYGWWLWEEGGIMMKIDPHVFLVNLPNFVLIHIKRHISPKTQQYLYHP